MDLPEAFLTRMRSRLGGEFEEFLRSYRGEAVKGLRVNSLKCSAEEFASLAPFPLEGRVPWEKDGFYLSEEKPGADVWHFAGLYYLQEPSAMCAAPLLGVRPKERVLDLCAAPGGKTTRLAAEMGGEGILVANEIDPARAKILSSNVERMGIVNCAVVSASPEALKKKFPSCFDKVLVDAPCSGEGMFRKEPNALPEWSEGNVTRCALRQREILDCAAELLSAGGKLVYSTCTFAEEEDEWQIEAFLARHPEFSLISSEKLYPHRVRGEGHFAALLEKREGERRKFPKSRFRENRAAEGAFAAFAADFFSSPKNRPLAVLPDGRMYLLPEDAPDLSGLRCLRLGVEAGEWDGKRFKPAHALVMAGKKGDFRRFLSLSREEAKRYLRGETVPSPLADGWCAVGAGDFPLGLGKCVDGVVKNHLPKGLRLFSRDN